MGLLLANIQLQFCFADYKENLQKLVRVVSNIKRIFIRCLNQYLANVSILNFLKTPKNQRFSSVFRGNKMLKLVRNWLIYYKYLVGKYLLKFKKDVILISWLLPLNRYLFLVTFEQRFDHCNIFIASTDNFDWVVQANI